MSVNLPLSQISRLLWRIGIELTQLIREPDANRVSIKAHSKYADQILKQAELLYNKAHNLCLMVHVDFKCSYGLSTTNPIQLRENDVKELSKYIANFVIQQLPKIRSSKHGSMFRYESFDWHERRMILPEKIEYISITNTSEFKYPCWSAIQGGVIPEIYNSNEFKTIITKKNTKPKNYKKAYFQIWLLIVEDAMNLTSYFSVDENEPQIIITPFDRIFILRRSQNTFIELQVDKQ
ncbi:MAG: hypothetical protein JKY70_03315 [Mucilaginibacter sp.]|nr:hypothetical protein [Mucilaginibacter sp.]